MIRPLFLAASVFALAGAAHASITLKVNTPDGATIHGEHKFVITADSTNLVTQVEFYVGTDLRTTDNSTPYEFTLDTLSEKEGNITVTFAGYTSEGESDKKTYTYKIDNGLSRGAAAHITEAKAALTERKWDAAMASAKIALLIEPENNEARMVMARANFGKGVSDLAMKYVEDVLASDPKNPQALELLAGINIDRAFNTFSTGDRMATINSIAASLKRAGDSRHATMENQVASFGEVTDANFWQYMNLLMDSGRYSLVIEKLIPRAEKDRTDSYTANYLMYAQMRAGRFGDAQLRMKIFEKFGSPDVYTYALKAILYQYFGDQTKALEAEREAILNDPSNIGVKYAQVYNALSREDAGALSRLLADLQKNENPSPMTEYFKSALMFRLQQNNEAADAIRASLLANPGLYDAYIERGNQIVFYSMSTTLGTEEANAQRMLAKAMFETALAIKPESFEAFTGLAALHMLWNKNDEALGYVNAAVSAGPQYAPAQYVKSAILMSMHRSAEASDAIKAAEKLDPFGLRGRPSPQPMQAFRYYYRSGRTPLIAPPVKG
jgi:Tfp pilus assembly protein PilF